MPISSAFFKKPADRIQGLGSELATTQLLTNTNQLQTNYQSTNNQLQRAAARRSIHNAGGSIQKAGGSIHKAGGSMHKAVGSSPRVQGSVLTSQVARTHRPHCAARDQNALLAERDVLTKVTGCEETS